MILLKRLKIKKPTKTKLTVKIHLVVVSFEWHFEWYH